MRRRRQKDENEESVNDSIWCAIGFNLHCLKISACFRILFGQGKIKYEEN